MHRFQQIKAYVLLVVCLLPFLPLQANEPDSVYLFAYSTAQSNGLSGLCIAWSPDRKHWNAIGPEYRFLFCDYGRWGSQKRMLNPYLYRTPDKVWHCVWSVNESDGVVACASSEDLIYWKPQVYPDLMNNSACLLPVIDFDSAKGMYTLCWKSSENKFYSSSTSGFVRFSPAIQCASLHDDREKVMVNSSEEYGKVTKVAWSVVENLLNKQQLDEYRAMLYREHPADDQKRWPDLQPLTATLKFSLDNKKPISDKLIGVFFEDINYAADGGLYAELIQNRDFEYALSDKEGRDKTWNNTKAWVLTGEQSSFTIDTVAPVHPNNRHYAVLKTAAPGACLTNEGYDGIALKAGEKYNFSLFLKSAGITKILVRLVNGAGEIVGQTTVNVSSKWKKAESVIAVSKTIADGRLQIIPQSVGTLNLDMISLFPQHTFRNRKNGLRDDLARLIGDIHPRFVRFPGGCVAHGDGLGNIYRWKNTIGPLESRKPMRNLWGYHQSVGLGYFEYFQFCEDIGAEPLPVLAAGVPCQNSATGGAGQQGGVPLCEMDQYIQDILDLVEWANGDAKTYWGKQRVLAGHPKPFNLKYIGIGNEDLINDIFETRFTAIYKAIKAKHPEITVIGTVGPNSEGTDYVEGWKIATKLGVPMVDEHYYQSPGWFIHNQDYYDKYDRSKPGVYLGEYASRGNTLANALSEALYMTSLERNADVVLMSSYAPLLAKEGHTQWNPDMIYFNNEEVKPTVNYYVQKMFGQNSGNQYVWSDLKLSDSRKELQQRVACSVVQDSITGDVIIKLVNVLPVELKVKIESGLVANSAVTQCLTGNLKEKYLQPTTGELKASGAMEVSLPPYAFRVIRVGSK